jgi:predicted ribosome quality control (RQC) complex YloA/Tae2 family protein
MDIGQYGSGAVVTYCDSFGNMLDRYFATRDRENKVKQNATDIMKVLTNTENRITRKLTAQREELLNCERGVEYKKTGDLITANLYKIKYGDCSVKLTDYSECDENGECPVITIELSTRLSPAANAQLMYKKYNKSKTARIELTKQIKLGGNELEYVRSISEALSRAEKLQDLEEIRSELYLGGYISNSKQKDKKKQKIKTDIQKFKTENGYIVLCGRNNIQNDMVTHKMASKTDVWFHVRGLHGSHTVMLCEGEEPSEIDYTQAAKIAAYYSNGREGENVAVDYTYIKNLKKPAGSKPGFVTYSTNYTAYVTPNKEEIEKLKI